MCLAPALLKLLFTLTLPILCFCCHNLSSSISTTVTYSIAATSTTTTCTTPISTSYRPESLTTTKVGVNYKLNTRSKFDHSSDPNEKLELLSQLIMVDPDSTYNLFCEISNYQRGLGCLVVAPLLENPKFNGLIRFLVVMASESNSTQDWRAVIKNLINFVCQHLKN